MSYFSIVLIAFGLSMDAFAVSISNGIMIRNLKLRHALKVGLYFGLFQAAMPVAGWLLGFKFKDYIVSIDHWIAFVLLAFIGGKMIKEAFGEEETEEAQCIVEAAVSKEDSECRELNNKYLIPLAIATSIDALAVGVSFAFLDVSVIQSAAIIGSITFILCSIGVMTGKKVGEVFKKHAEVAGGIVLILIGLKILLEHLGMLSFLG